MQEKEISRIYKQDTARNHSLQASPRGLRLSSPRSASHSSPSRLVSRLEFLPKSVFALFQGRCSGGRGKTVLVWHTLLVVWGFIFILCLISVRLYFWDSLAVLTQVSLVSFLLFLHSYLIHPSFVSLFSHSSFIPSFGLFLLIPHSSLIFLTNSSLLPHSFLTN